MTKPLLLAGLLGAFCLEASRASVLLDFDDGTGTPDAVTINPGDAFSFDVKLTSTAEETIGLTYFFAISTLGNPGNPGSGLFSISARDTTGTPFSELQTSNVTFLNVANAVLDPRNNRDAGGIEPDLIAQPAGTYLAAAYTIQTSSLLPVGTYILSFADAIYIDETFDPFAFGNSATYTVTVVPEPSVFGLVGLGLLLLHFRRPHRRSNGRAKFSVHERSVR